MPATPVLWRDLGQVNLVDGSGADTDDQFDPKVIGLSNGNILVSWTSTATVGAASPAGTDIIGRIYDSRGNVVVSEIRLNTFSTADDERDADIAATANGGFVVVYTDVDSTVAGKSDVILEEYNAAGVSIDTAVISSDSGSAFSSSKPSVVVRDDTAFISLERGITGGGFQVMEGIYDLATSTLDSLSARASNSVASSSPFSEIEVAALQDGRFVTIFSDDVTAPQNDSLIGTLSSSTGSAAGLWLPGDDLNFDFKQNPSVAALTGGGAVAVWAASATDSAQKDIYFERLDPNTGAQSSVAVVTNIQNEVDPVVAALADGGFIVGWYNQTDQDITAWRYNATGSKVGSAFDVDTDTVDGGTVLANSIDVAGLADGRMIFTWEESRETAPGVYDVDIAAKIYDPRDTPNGTPAYDTDQIIGTPFGDLIPVRDTDGQVFGWDGNDDFDFPGTYTDTPDVVDGGEGNDRLFVLTNDVLDFRGKTVLSIERLEFNASGTKTVIFDAAHVTDGGLDPALAILGATDSDNLNFHMGDETYLSLAGFSIGSWESAIDRLRVQGDDDAETIIGSTRNDTINGQGGADTLFGILGDDILVGGGGGDFLSGGAGAGDFASYVNAPTGVLVDMLFMFANTGEAAGDSFQGIENLDGSQHADSLRGDNGANLLAGQGGNDALFGRNSDDQLFGGEGNDQLIGGLGADDLFGGNGIDAASYTQATTAVHVDILVTGANSGEAAGDTFSSIENIVGSLQGDTLLGNGNTNSISGYVGNDTIYGRSGADQLFGSNGVDVLFGGTGDDDLFGGAGGDLLLGEDGADLLFGGGDNDIFRFDDVSHSTTDVTGRDSILDFTQGQDLINLSLIDANTGAAGNNAFTFIGAAAFTAAGQLRFSNSVLEADVDGDGAADFAVAVAGLGGGALTAGDFIL